MALIIEDGSNVENANSYVPVADLVMYARMRSVTIPDMDEDIEALLIRAMDFLESLRAKYQGEKTNASQLLQWPRTGVTVDNFSVDKTDIPRELKYGQMALALEAQENDLLENETGKGPVISEKIGPIDIKYENTGKVEKVAAFAKANALLAPLFKRNGLTLIRS